MLKENLIYGIDEAGRGPIAGPLSVAVVKVEDVEALREDFDTEPLSFMLASPFKDSKKLSEKRRDAIFEYILQAQHIKYEHIFLSAKYIDKHGISEALQKAVADLLLQIGAAPSESVILDGALKAPDIYNWKSVTKGDEKFIEVALASVVAKVLRDRYMIEIAKKYPGYYFEKHKGYGTKAHFDALRKLGVTHEHRLSFLKKLD